MNGDLSDDELTAMLGRYGYHTPKHPCPKCGGTDWAIAATGRGRTSWVCRKASDAYPDERAHYQISHFETTTGDPRVGALVAEIRRHRAMEAAISERVREAVRGAVFMSLSSDGAPCISVDAAYRFADRIADHAASRLGVREP